MICLDELIIITFQVFITWIDEFYKFHKNEYLMMVFMNVSEISGVHNKFKRCAAVYM